MASFFHWLLWQIILCKLVAAGISFVAVGDWGGRSDHHPTTDAQVETASGMASVAKALGSSAVLLLGDNFYESGVGDASSPRFQETFEDVYRTDLFNSVPFLVVAGNHDHRGNVSAQTCYVDSGLRWHFPALFYTTGYNYTSKAEHAREVLFIMIDTVVLAGISDDDCRGCQLPGPLDAEEADRHWAWLEEQLQQSTADFLFVVGHYPIYSAGDDGTTEVLVKKLLPLLSKYGAQYLSGHDHMLEHLSMDGVNMYLAGAGRECCYGTEHLHTVPDGVLKYMISGDDGTGTGVGPKPSRAVKGGFAGLQFDEVASVSYYDEKGSKLYDAPLVQPRHGSKFAVTQCVYPGGHCYELRFQRCEGSKRWTLHGLWPEWTNYCEGPAFDQSLLPNETLMDEAWPSCPEYGESNVDFWTHEWEKHGRCTSLDQKAYFAKALELAHLYKERCAEAIETCMVCTSQDFNTEEQCSQAQTALAETIVM
mmetsp:Transcript_55994/g.131037  ORF Transcript_55994/g.131037 Transcript_55994/m.131037 type:complete len:479 (+) Transcript_55994:43-1479(+)